MFDSMGAYKFLNSKYLDSFLAGRLRLGSLESYRSIENPEIRDEREGIDRAFQSGAIVPNTREMHQRLLAVGIDAGRGATLINNTFVRSIGSTHIFCYSAGPLQELKKRWSSYDACVEILDPNAFASKIWERGSVGGMDLKRFAEGMLHAPVAYTYRDTDISVEDPLPLHLTVFRKEPRFSPDSEYRLALISRNTGGAVFVDVPDAASLFRVVRL